MLKGYSFLFYLLMTRLEDQRGSGAEDRWASASIALLYIFEITALLNMGSGSAARVSFVPHVSGAIAICALVFGANHLLFMRDGRWEVLRARYGELDSLARFRHICSLVAFLVLSTTIIAGATWAALAYL